MRKKGAEHNKESKRKTENIDIYVWLRMRMREEREPEKLEKSEREIWLRKREKWVFHR